MYIVSWEYWCIVNYYLDLILNMIDGIEKPALAGLWPNNNGMNVVLDLGANIECNEKI